MLLPRKNNKTLLLWAEIDLGALRHNLKLLQASIHSKKTEVLAVVKADAYGHGMEAVAKTLAGEGVGFFGVATIDEAVKLRKICPSQKILVLGSFHKEQLNDFFSHKIIPTLSSLEDARFIENFLKNKNRDFPVHVKIDTGMGRLGVWHKEVGGLFITLKKMKHIRVDGVYTHFSSADKESRDFTLEQLRIFNKSVEIIRKLGFDPRYLHAANSIGSARFKEAHFNLIRPGIMLYGIDPASFSAKTKMRPVLSLHARISYLKVVEKGRSISYGATFKTRTKSLIATLPIGYSHGYRVAFSNKADVLVAGKRASVAGRVTMDQTLINVGRISKIKRWDVVTLIGREGKEVITAEELAGHASTIPYEILCAIHPRIPRIYKNLKK